MTGTLCRGCGREFSGGEQFCPDDGLRLTTPSQIGDRKHADALIGMTLDARYRVIRVIGEGGMGVVYAAEHVLIEKQVAIKVLRDTFTSRPDVVERFRQEAKSASRIGHPNIVDVSDFGETPSGQSYIVMEMLTGEDLADVLGRERMLAPARAVRIVYQVARALHATHKKNIVHRDLKPENIYLIERDGAADIVKVVDFGVAKMSDVETPVGRRLTRTGMIFGTPEYMSPEQALGKPFDHRVDIYAIGAIFFELLTGRVPFEGDNFMEILAKHGTARVPTLYEANPDTKISPELERVVMRSLCKNPDQRYQTMGELASDLRAVPEMPSVEPGNALEPPVWALSDVTPVATPVRPPPLPNHRHHDTLALSDSDLLTAVNADSVRGSSAPDTLDAVVLDAPRNALWAGEGAGSGDMDSLRPTSRKRERNTTGRTGFLVSLGVRGNRLISLAAIAAAVGLITGYVLKRVREADAVTLSSVAPAAPPESAAPREIATPTAPVAQPEKTLADSSAPRRMPAPPVEEAQVQKVLPPHVAHAARLQTAAHHDADAMVEVQVRTQPAGASVRAVGMSAHCSVTPCALEVPRGRPVTLRAESSVGSVERTLTFEDNTEVELRVSPSTHVKPTLRPTSSSKQASDLKVPAIFREP